MIIIIALISFVLGFICNRTIEVDKGEVDKVIPKEEKLNSEKVSAFIPKPPTKQELEEHKERKWIQALKKYWWGSRFDLTKKKDHYFPLKKAREDEAWCIYFETNKIVGFVYIDIFSWLNNVSLNDLAYGLASVYGEDITKHVDIHLQLYENPNVWISIKHNAAEIFNYLLVQFTGISYYKYVEEVAKDKIEKQKKAEQILGEDYLIVKKGNK